MNLKDERGSLPLALLVVTLALSMSAMLMPVVVRQINTTEGAVDRNVQLNSAQVGLDVLMARVRAAAEYDPKKGAAGLLENLPPCVITGNTGPASDPDSSVWDVTITYYDADHNKLNCPLSKVPSTAELESKGANGSGARTLTATYVFSTNNTNIPGGAVRIDSSSIGKLCLDASQSKPLVAGAKVWMLACDGGAAQQFGYTPELFLKLINSETTAYPKGLCLSQGTDRAGNSPLYITFQQCPDPSDIDSSQCGSSCQYQFQWALDGSSRFRSTDTKKQTTESYCMTMQSPNTSKSLVVLSNKACSGDGTNVIWRSDPSVGAGMAGDDTNQLVNYSQFSRCLDVTNLNVSSTYMIAWFCKQAPDKNIDWNQMWQHTPPVDPAVSSTDIITINKDKKSNSRYCLKSPLSTASNAYTTVVSCPEGSDTSDNELQWTIYHNTGSYATSYRIVDANGYCLTPTDLSATPKDTHSDGTSKVKVAVCTGSELQKWNAPANLKLPTPLTNIVEK
jgi:hypothetical protein